MPHATQRFRNMTAVYFSGFGFANENALFAAPQSAVRECLDVRECDVVGFSYGAQKAVRYALHATRPIRRLCLLSPAFFHGMPTKRKEAELRLFAANPTRYLRAFLQQALGDTDASEAQRELVLPYFCLAAPESIHADALGDDLRALLFYAFCADELAQICARGIEIEVFLGAKDRIVNALEARDFFAPLATRLFWVRDAGHLLLL